MYEVIRCLWKAGPGQNSVHLAQVMSPVPSISLSAFRVSPPSLLLHYPQQFKPGKCLPGCSPGIGFQQVPWTPCMASKGSCQLPHTEVTRVEKCFPKGKLRGSYQRGNRCRAGRSILSCPLPSQPGARVLSAKSLLSRSLEPNKHTSIWSLTIFTEMIYRCVSLPDWTANFPRSGTTSDSCSVLNTSHSARCSGRRCSVMSLGSCSCICSQLSLHTGLAQSLPLLWPFNLQLRHRPSPQV